MAKFKTRARTVDLLGRQQIAGIPTAVHELFKNAHDAYADHVEVDYFRSDGLFVLRDDGLGMTRTEFEERWLVVGTESKVSGPKQMASPPTDPNKPLRPVLGEKGIGRLAIGIVGDQVLILSRAIRPNERHPLVAAFIHWEVFSLPGVDLDEIEIPIIEVDGDDGVDQDVVDELVSRFRACIERLVESGRVDHAAAAPILKQLGRFRFSPSEMESYLPGSNMLRLASGGRGTQFWVVPSNEVLPSDLEVRNDTKDASRMEGQLLGFANTMTPDAPEPVMATAFRDHRTATDVRDIIAPELFFTPGEFRNADHYITGRLDELGQFTGDVSVFGEVYPDYVIPYHGRRGKPLRCGPFEVHLAYVQGDRKETTLPDEDWWAFYRKSDRLGGVYIYIDGVRVLPYGMPDFDWLEIEERRSKSAGYYFFSHRRMCGAVLLSREHNGGLQQKAGREGYIGNASYRDLHDVLASLLERLAAEFFRKDKGFGEKFLTRKAANVRHAKALEKVNASSRERQKQLEARLEGVLNDVDAESPRIEVAELSQHMQATFEAALDREDDGLPSYLVTLEHDFRVKLSALRAKYNVTVPRVALPKRLDRALRQYRTLARELEDTLFAPAERQLDELTTTALEAVGATGQFYERLKEATETAIQDAQRQLDEQRSRVTTAITSAKKTVTEGASRRRDEGRRKLDEIGADVARLGATLRDDAALNDARTLLLARVAEASDTRLNDLRRMAEQLESITWEAESAPLEQLTAVEQDAEDLREQLDDELETAQLGMTVEVISHEFDHAISDIRHLLRELKPWADANPDLAKLYVSLRDAFQHLDAYLTLFTPLQRRLYRTTTIFTGADIAAYLYRLFGQRLSNDGVTLTVTPLFEQTSIRGYPSTYYPIFVNLLDNAIWWLKGRPDARIQLTAGRGALRVVDNGPGVAVEDRELVFQRRFSLKPGGRGLGLTISRDAIRKVGGDLRIDDTHTGASFRIILPKDALLNEEDGT